MAAVKFIDVVRRESGETLLRSVRWCSSNWCRLRGLQFRRRLAVSEAILLVHPQESVLQTSIHMLFVFFPIAAIWIDGMGRVTSTQLARPWRIYYASKRPAQYVLEGHPDLLNRVAVGDELNFITAT
jgi:hypothetical protein